MLVEMILKSFNRVDLINRLKDLYSVHAFLNVIITVDSWLAYLFKTWNSWIPFSYYVSTIRIEITCCRRQEAKTSANMQGQNIPKINKPVMTCYFLEASSYDFFPGVTPNTFPPATWGQKLHCENWSSALASVEHDWMNFRASMLVGETALGPSC